MALFSLLNRHRAIILYLFFGVCTTLVNVLAYGGCYRIIGLSNALSTISAWAIAVLFAFITNKLWVFESRDLHCRAIMREGASFVLCRLLTGLLDLGIMFLAVDMLRLSPLLWKILANIIVILANWLASKWLIFRKPQATRVSYEKENH